MGQRFDQGAPDCPECGEYAKRYASYRMEDGTFRRYRECPSCGHQFKTDERKVNPPQDQQEDTDDGTGSEDFLAEFEKDVKDPRGG